MRILVVAAHADDETIGMSHLLVRSAGECLLYHATDGAPRNLRFAREAGFDSREQYAAARRAELLDAMHLAGIGPAQCVQGEAADQEAMLSVAEIARRTAELRTRWRPERIYTHAYEGGHPDHDAVALAVRLACPGAAVWEFAGYHGWNGKYEVMRFLPGGPEEEVVVLDAAGQDRKRSMFSRFASQLRVLSRFPVDLERIRPAPDYDFRQPPHADRLYYESRDLGWTGSRWRDAAARFL